MSFPIITEAIEPCDRKACFSIRIDVFCVEQKVNRDIEFDGLDEHCSHYLARLDNKEIGTARVRPLDKYQIKFERVAVRRAHRKAGVGRQLMLRAITDAAKSGYTSAFLYSQLHACPFYEKLGFSIESDIFYEAGIPHRSMRKIL
ncbi:MAG: GNAT family N-acetyltransferase [Pseudomonadota bacterium]|nr:GNAT family N-acetyltransferase [Pseudomonadota bacterium]